MPARLTDCACGQEPKVTIFADGAVGVACDPCGLAVLSGSFAVAASAWNTLDRRGSLAVTPHPGGTAMEGG